MSRSEVKITLGLALLMGIRMLGLFMVLPVFSVYGQNLEGATLSLIGLAVGVYGLTQACMQIPFGRLSDRWGRKPVIALGLMLFAVGSLVAGYSDSIYGVIAGRALQGSGAVASTIMALLGDLIRDEHRSKAMAMLGMSIGVSFCVAMVVGPVIAYYFSFSGLFLITAGLALVGLLINFRLPTPIIKIRNRESFVRSETLGGVLKNIDLWRLNMGIFVLHMGLTALFLLIPLLLVDSVGLSIEVHWQVYLPIMIGAFFVMLPFMIIAERKRRVRLVFKSAVLVLVFSLWLMAKYSVQPILLLASLSLYFLAFNLLEALLPSLVSRFAPAASKGSAMGVYSASQFMGAFVGGALGGYLLESFGGEVLLLSLAGVALLWLLVSFTMSEPVYAQTKMIYLGRMARPVGEKIAQRLLAVQGVNEATVLAEEGTAYLKVDRKRLDQRALNEFMVVR